MYLIYLYCTQPYEWDRTPPATFPGGPLGQLHRGAGVLLAWMMFHDDPVGSERHQPRRLPRHAGDDVALANHGVQRAAAGRSAVPEAAWAADRQAASPAARRWQAFRAGAPWLPRRLVLGGPGAIARPGHVPAQYLGGHYRYRPESAWPTTRVDGHARGRRWRPATCASPSTRSPAPADRRRPPGFLPGSATPYLAGPCRPDADAASVWSSTVPRTGGSSATCTPGASPGSFARQPVPGEPGHRRCPRQRYHRVAGAVFQGAPARAATPRSSPSPSGGWSRAYAVVFLLARYSRRSMWAMSWGVQIPPRGRRTRRTRAITVDAPAADGRAPHCLAQLPGTPRRAACSPRSGG